MLVSPFAPPERGRRTACRGVAGSCGIVLAVHGSEVVWTRIGIGDTEVGEDGGFEGLHDLRLGVGLMIIAQQVRDSMDNEMAQMVGKTFAVPV